MGVIVDANKIAAAFDAGDFVRTKTRRRSETSSFLGLNPAPVEHSIEQFGLQPMQGVPSSIRVKQIDVLDQSNVRSPPKRSLLQGPIALGMGSHHVEGNCTCALERPDSRWKFAQHIPHGSVDCWLVNGAPPFHPVAEEIKDTNAEVNPVLDVFGPFKSSKFIPPHRVSKVMQGRHRLNALGQQFIDQFRIPLCCLCIPSALLRHQA